MANNTTGDDWEPGWAEMGYPSEAEYLAYEAFQQAEHKRLTETVKPEGFTVHTRHGSEGPHHDPYSFTEITVGLPDGREFRYHGGLGEDLRLRTLGNGWETIANGDGAREQFEALVGFPCDQLEWWADAPYRGVPCMACGCEGCRGKCCE